ncbi:piggyBac transposable element-derived protein 3 [Leptinotarsa decemlineata]|uniref:piggyBac transposable element-derived protein 3 n=1 Tax=Leptinotarsa decemlineata TaxID=7539 RepID=UPI003D30796C
MSNAKRILSEAELIEYWENFTGLESEDGGDECETDSEDEPSCSVPENDFTDEVGLVEFPGEPLETIEQEVRDNEDNLPLSFFQQNDKQKKVTQENIIWKQKAMQLNEDQLQFHGETELATDIRKLESPYDFFTYFFSKELFDKIVEETNLFSVQKKPERPTVFTDIDIKQYIGIVTYMSLANMPNTRSFWSDDLRFSNIADVMPVNKFEKIRQYIHFNDNDAFIPPDRPGHDRLHKIRPLVDHLNKKCSSVALEQHLSIDEQMCSTKVRHYMKQYMPMKPHKWGFKFFVLAGVSGFAYKFEIYTGQEKFENTEDNEPNFGVTSNIVLRLARIIPRMKNYRLYHDNYYTAVPLMVHLAKQGIFSLGTIRRNRLPNCQLPNELSLKKVSRGTSHEYVATVDGVDISSLIWKDNKYVTLISSFAGKNPVSKVKRFDRKKKEKIEVDCPYIISEYNRHMGGVDLLDGEI